MASCVRAEEVCPIVLSKAERIHWPIKEPASEQELLENIMLERFRIARDELKVKLEQFTLKRQLI